jgi:DNA-binding protein H-NS
MARLSLQDQFAKLQKQKSEIDKLQAILVDRDAKKSLAKIIAMIEQAVSLAHGIAAHQAMGKGAGVAGKKRGRPAGRSKLAGRKVPPKYRNPKDKEQTWTGRGRMPLWAAELHAAGRLKRALIKD